MILLSLVPGSNASAKAVVNSSPESWDIPVVERFLWPVGHPRNFVVAAAGENTGFTFIRGVRHRGRPHRGVDLSNGRMGGRVRAPAPGIVLHAGWASTWGNVVVIGHRLPGGEIVASVLAHLRNRSIVVELGERVSAGQIVGRVGRTGRSTGPHLHFELRRLGYVDPQSASWMTAPILDPVEVLGTHLADAFVPNQGVQTHWGWNYIRLVSGRSDRAIGDPDALLSRSEFYSWATRAAGDPLGRPVPGSLVRSRLAQLGLGEHLSGLTTVERTIGAAEAAEALERLSSRGWLRSLSGIEEVGHDELTEHGMTDVTDHLTNSPHAGEEDRRPLTRAQGALLILAARSLAPPATAVRQ